MDGQLEGKGNSYRRIRRHGATPPIRAPEVFGFPPISYKEGTTERDLFSAGLLSVLDALLDIPIEEALGDLPLADNAKASIIDRSGAIGQALRCTVAYERVDWDEVQFYGLAQGPIRDCYMDAVAWSRQLLGGIAG